MALASGSAVPVGLKLVGSADRNVGDSATLTATAKLPAGAHLLIDAFRGGKNVAAKVRECLRSPCTASFRDTVEENVQFQALAIKHSGKKTTVLGRSPRVTVGWTEPTPPPPPPPPPPAATPGHFAGTIGNAAASLGFDIGADGLSMTNWVTGEIDESCDPSTCTFWFTGMHGAGPYPVATDGSFAVSGSGSDPTLTYSIKFTGKIAGASASSILHVESSYTLDNGTQLNGSSGDQPWTATKTG